MKKVLLSLLLVATIFSCRNSFEAEHQQIVDLQTTIDEAEKVLLAIDTVETFTMVREFKQELWRFGAKYDSLDKEAAFKMADYYANKKSLYFLYDNYAVFVKEIDLSRKQLLNLKKDLDNNIIDQKKFEEYLITEKNMIVSLDEKIKNSAKSIVISMDRIKASKVEVKEILKKYKKEQD